MILTVEGKRFSGLAEALYDNYDSVKELYPYDYLSPEDWKRRIAWLDANPGADRGSVSSALLALNQRLGGEEKTLENIRLLGQNNSLTVVTGQQTGLFTGPLYTLYKAATTIKKAKELQKLAGRPVIPVFWMATEDHDFAEIAMNWHFDGNKVTRIRLPRSHKNSPPVGGLPVSIELEKLCNTLCSTLDALPEGTQMAALLRNTLKASENLGDWFGRLILKLFAPWGLVVLDPCAPDMREIMKPFFKRCLESTLEIQHGFDQGTRKTTSLGFKAEMEMGKGQTGIFLIDQGDRSPFYSNETGTVFSLRDGDSNWTREALIDRLEQQPQDFSTGAALRPVLQDWLLPVAAAVLGPSETAYHAQLTPIYGHMNRQLPILVPRESWTLATEEGAISHDRILELLQGNPEDWVSDRIMDTADPTMRNRIAAYNEQYQNHVSTLIASLPISSDARERLGEGALQMQVREMKWMTKQLRRSLSTEAEEYGAYRSFARMLRPFGKVQERTLLPWYFLSQFGMRLIAALTEAEFSSDMRIVIGGKPS